MSIWKQKISESYKNMKKKCDLHGWADCFQTSNFYSNKFSWAW